MRRGRKMRTRIWMVSAARALDVSHLHHCVVCRNVLSVSPESHSMDIDGPCPCFPVVPLCRNAIHSLFRFLTHLRRLGTHPSPSRGHHAETPRATVKGEGGRRPLVQAGEDRHGSRWIQHQGCGCGCGEGAVGQGPEGEGGERGGERWGREEEVEE
jgi:hypothetical protein